MRNRLVSILTPMYNTEKYVHRLLDSVLSQDYPEIEMVVIDDGSTDDSRSVVESYVSRFSARGYSLYYYYQENAGQSYAIKKGLELISGEYLSWPDSDDYYAANNVISKMVAVLDNASPDFQMVRTQETLVDDETLRPIMVFGLDAHEEEDQSLFEDCLFSKNGYYFCPGAYMTRTAVLKELTGFDIYTERNAGQNWQLMLPILYSFRCKTILEPLYNVVSRPTSHSRGQYSTFDKSIVKYEAYLNTLIETLKRIKGLPNSQRVIYQEQLQTQYRMALLHLAIQQNNRQEAIKCLASCKADMGKSEFMVKSFFIHLGGGTYLINFYKRIHHVLYLIKERMILFLRR